MKYIIGFVSVIVLLIVLVAIFSRGGNDDRTQEQRAYEEAVKLVDYASQADTTVEYFIDGEINGDEEHRSIRITVSQGRRTIELLKGYQQSIERTESFNNNQQAYESFLYAIDRAGFTSGRETELENEKGVCPTGTRTVYEARDGSETKLRLWSASCGRRIGTYAGNVSTVRSLFENQIPNYRDLTRDFQL